MATAETDPRTARVLEAARAESRVEHIAHTLTDQFPSRVTGSRELTRAAEWARDEFARYGLSNVRLEKFGETPLSFERGPASGRVVTPVARDLVVRSDAWSAPTDGAVRARAALAPAHEGELPGARERLRGAWVLVNPAQPVSREFAVLRDALFTDAGIRGVVLPGSGDVIHVGGVAPGRWEDRARTPRVRILARDWSDIAARIAAGGETELEFNIDNRTRKNAMPLYNVSAEIRGSERPDEMVIVGGHLDAWDGGSGATDNAAGVASVMDAARILAASGVAPRRTIRFVLWSGEEQGLLGSTAYVHAHRAELARISAVLVMDAGTNAVSGLAVSDAVRADVERAFKGVAALGVSFAVSSSAGVAAPVDCAGGAACAPDQSACSNVCETGVAGKAACPSDHAPFLRAGVPAFMFEQSGKNDYTRTHHTHLDTRDALDLPALRQSAAVIALGVFGLADLPGLLSRDALLAP